MSNLKKAHVYKTLCVLWFIVFVISVAFIILNSPVICWDGFDKLKNQMIGGCYREYSIGIMLSVFLFIIWLIVEVILFAFYRKYKKQVVLTPF